MRSIGVEINQVPMAKREKLADVLVANAVAIKAMLTISHVLRIFPVICP
jgi:hypothetical protein